MSCYVNCVAHLIKMKIEQYSGATAFFIFYFQTYDSDRHRVETTCDVL